MSVDSNTMNYSFWAGRSGSQWHEKTRERWNGNRSFFSDRVMFLQVVRSFLRDHPRSTLCEIGFGNGCLLQYLASELPEIERFVGLEINSDQVDRLRATNEDRRITVVHTLHTGDYIKAHDFRDTLFITSGTSVCCTKEVVQELFEGMSHFADAGFILQECVNFDVITATQSELRVEVQELGGTMRMFSHPYFHLFNEFGFTVSDATIESEDENEIYYDTVTMAGVRGL